MPNAAVTDIRQSPNYSPGRPYGPPDHIVIHHWGGDGQSHDAVVAYLCRAGGDSSAHYVVSDGRVTQLVADTDMAWHAGSSGNPRGIGIECRPEASPGDIATLVRLIAALRAQWGPLPLRGHRDHMPTACPGRWYPMLAEISARATTTAPAPASAPAQAPTTREDTSVYLIRTTTPWNTYAYALITLAGIGGARAITQEEADYYYPVLGVRPVGWATWNGLVERAWQAHAAAIKAIGGAVDVSIADEVDKIIQTVKAIGTPAPAAGTEVTA